MAKKEVSEPQKKLNPSKVDWRKLLVDLLEAEEKCEGDPFALDTVAASFDLRDMKREIKHLLKRTET